jgi:hypothetical protein
MHLPYGGSGPTSVAVPVVLSVVALFRVPSARRRRLVCGVRLSSAAASTLSAFSDNLVLFVSPSDPVKSGPNGRQVRPGSL